MKNSQPYCTACVEVVCAPVGGRGGGDGAGDASKELSHTLQQSESAGMKLMGPMATLVSTTLTGKVTSS